ncbi:hypothetical protein IMY05_014G0087800 [Salix suchowensis]|nr:hypothetical protein IMY05_014G0087800 [Salix suchowensis]
MVLQLTRWTYTAGYSRRAKKPKKKKEKSGTDRDERKIELLSYHPNSYLRKKWHSCLLWVSVFNYYRRGKPPFSAPIHMLRLFSFFSLSRSGIQYVPVT